MLARLALENGLVLHGTAFGATDETRSTTGEVVFNTAMCGYQEAITDPSYAGQILTLTAPQIGNYGITAADGESERPQIAGLVIRELSRIVSNHRAVTDLSSWLASAGVVGIAGVDTRALVRRLRLEGAMRGLLSTDAAPSDDDLVDLARLAPQMAGQNLAAKVTPRASFDWAGGLEGWWGDVVGPGGEPPLRVVAIDCGAKRNIYRHLHERGCRVHAVPFDTDPDAIRALHPDGLFISNGPGDPAAVEQTVRTLKAVAGEIPTFGICLGHQLLALAMGASTFKLPFGHRGANQPVRNERSGRVEITSQNHGFCVDPASLEALGCEATHIHLNDGTLAGFRHRTKPIFCVQYHPEASPGPHDSAYLFDEFVRLMREHRAAHAPA